MENIIYTDAIIIKDADKREVTVIMDKIIIWQETKTVRGNQFNNNDKLQMEILKQCLIIRIRKYILRFSND